MLLNKIKSLLNPNKNLRQILAPDNLFQNYFWLFIIGTLVQLTLGKGYIISILIPCIIYYLALNRKNTIGRFNVFDILWFFFLLLNLQSWLFNDYPYKMELIGRYFFAQGAYMMAYWIGRGRKSNYLQNIIQNSFVPLLIVALIGLYTYVFRPGWYMNMMMSQFENVGQQSFQEFARLRSIFSSPYVLAYFCSMALSWHWFQLLSPKKVNKTHYIYIAIVLATSVFCMMRAPLACSLLSLSIAALYNSLYGKTMIVFKRLLPFFGIVVMAGFLLFTKMDSEDFSFLIEKFESVTNSGSDLVYERAHLYEINTSMFGTGAGRHAFYADEYPPNFQLPDNEYQKMQVEVGYVGMICACVIFILGLLKCIKNFRYLYYELCIISMCLITMIGASSLTIVNEHPFIFWLALGQVSAFKKYYIKREL